MHREIVGVFILLLLLGGCKKENDKTNSKVSRTQIFQNVLDSIYSKHEDALGIMAHIEAPDKRISWSGAKGISNKTSRTAIEKEQPVLIASNTKTYVAVAILKLIEGGEVKLDDPIFKFLSNNSKKVLQEGGYDIYDVTIKDLMSHTSGIFDYASSDEYLQRVKTKPRHRWTRDEQIQLAISLGEPLGLAGDVFAYSDTNYLLLTEIIEIITKKEFYDAIRDLIDYKSLGMNATWFSTLEDYPENVKSMAQQYVTSEGLDSYKVDHSFDLYGGGGIASTTRDLSVFLHNLFNNNIFKNQKTLDLIYTKANPKQLMQGNYSLGISFVNFDGVKGYGHSGFWGTTANYFPELNASISVFVLERDQRHLRIDVNKALINALKKY